MFYSNVAWVSESRRSGYEVSTTLQVHSASTCAAPVEWIEASFELIERLTTKEIFFSGRIAAAERFASSSPAFSVAKSRLEAAQ